MNYEKVLKDKIFPELEKGRPNWDKPHTEAVVFYVKEIIKHSKELELDKDVLVIAGYAHDWGYAGLFKGGKHLSLDEINSEKKLHMILGAEKLARLLNNKVFDFLTSKQKKRAIHLVGVHDKLNLLKDTDELVLMEADTLASLDAKKQNRPLTKRQTLNICKVYLPIDIHSLLQITRNNYLMNFLG